MGMCMEGQLCKMATWFVVFLIKAEGSFIIWEFFILFFSFFLCMCFVDDEPGEWACFRSVEEGKFGFLLLHSAP